MGAWNVVTGSAHSIACMAVARESHGPRLRPAARDIDVAGSLLTFRFGNARASPSIPTSSVRFELATGAVQDTRGARFASRAGSTEGLDAAVAIELRKPELYVEHCLRAGARAGAG